MLKSWFILVHVDWWWADFNEMEQYGNITHEME